MKKTERRVWEGWYGELSGGSQLLKVWHMTDDPRVGVRLWVCDFDPMRKPRKAKKKGTKK